MPIRAASACTERWSSFEPRPGGRHCGSCDVTVVDLSRLTRRRAEALVVAAGGSMCARLRVDSEGAPVFRPDAARAPSLLGVAAFGLLAAACDSGSASSSPASDTQPPPSLLDATSGTRFGGPLMTTEHTPMRPLGERGDETPTPSVVVAPTTETAAETAALGEAPVPTPEQLLLTEAKEAREDRGRTRRRRSRTTTASVAPGTLVHPLPPMGSPNPGNVSTAPTYLYLGGISYTP